jgi:hypothetical protein
VVGSAAPGRARRTKRPKAAAGDIFDDRRGILNLRMQACRAGRLNLRGGRNSRNCDGKRRSRQSREFSHQILRLLARGNRLSVAVAVHWFARARRREHDLSAIGPQRVDLEMVRQARAQFLDRIGLGEHGGARHEARSHPVSDCAAGCIEDFKFRLELDRISCQFNAGVNVAFEVEVCEQDIDGSRFLQDGECTGGVPAERTSCPCSSK